MPTEQEADSGFGFSEKPTVPEEEPIPNTHLRIRVVAQDSTETIFKVKKTMAMIRLMDNYSKRVGIDKSDLRFLFDAHRIGENDTPNSLEMLDGDAVEVYQEQVGGGRATFLQSY